MQAIETLDGRDHDGRRLTVNEAKPRTQGGAAAGVATDVVATTATFEMITG